MTEWEKAQKAARELPDAVKVELFDRLVDAHPHVEDGSCPTGRFAFVVLEMAGTPMPEFDVWEDE